MDNEKLKLDSIIRVGVLATSLVIVAEMPSYATMLEPESELYMNSENAYEIILDYPSYFRNTFSFSFQYDRMKIGTNVYEDNYPEIEAIEVPIVKKMIFQFNKPVKLEFS